MTDHPKETRARSCSPIFLKGQELGPGWCNLYTKTTRDGRKVSSAGWVWPTRNEAVEQDIHDIAYARVRIIPHNAEGKRPHEPWCINNAALAADLNFYSCNCPAKRPGREFPKERT